MTDQFDGNEPGADPGDHGRAAEDGLVGRGDERVSSREAAVIARARSWALNSVAPRAETWETERRFAAEAFSAAADAGLTGLLAPIADGGHDLCPVALGLLLEEAAAVDFSAAFSLVVHNNLAGAVARRSPSEQRSRWLPELVSGRRLGAFLLTEPGVGSDAASITTWARPDGDGWVLDGEKAWVSNGTAAGLLSVYATVDPTLGHRGIAAFLVEPDQPGVGRLDGYGLIGGHGLGTNGYVFDRCRLGPEALFVPPGAGFAAAMEGIDLARLVVAAMCCGMLRAGLDEAAARVAGRRAFGAPVADLQAVRFILADVATDLEAARLLTYRAARDLTEGASATVAAAHAKKFATRVTETGLAACMQVMGAAGARRDHRLPRHLAAARLAHYVDGATEIQNVVIARDLLPVDRPAADGSTAG